MRIRILSLFLAVLLLLSVIPVLGEELSIPVVDDETGVDIALEAPSEDSEKLIVVDEGSEDASDLFFVDLSGEISQIEPVDEAPDERDDLNAGAPNASSFEDGIIRVELPEVIQGSDALFAGYVKQLFGIGGTRPNGMMGDKLTGVTREVYDFLTQQITRAAAGKLESTEFKIPKHIVKVVEPYTELDELYESFDLLVNALYYDYPYELYWWDSCKGVNIRYEDELLYLGFTVTEDFAADQFSIQTDKAKKLQVAAKNAKALVRKNAGLSDYKKLCAYRDYILKATSYYNGTSDENKDPFTLIWVFDNDPSTNVVCEGYSEAFHCLCEMSDFRSDKLRCYRVGGALYVDETMPEEIDMDYNPHMWNIVTMDDGKNYLVDLTNSDDGTPGGKQGTEGSLFLAGYDVVNGDTYGIVAIDRGSFKLWFAYTLYESYRKMIPRSAQKLAKSDYKASSQPAKSVSIAEGKSATVYLGSELKLTAVVKPVGAATTLTWTSLNTVVATVSQQGVVTPKKAGTAKIRVRTDNGKSALIAVKVKAKAAVKPTKVTIANGKKATIKKGQKLTLTAKVTPEKARTNLKWSSSNKQVATVSNKGVVLAKASGRCTVTVETDNGKTASIQIIVGK